MKRLVYTLLVLFLLSETGWSQSGVRDSVIRFPLLGISYGLFEPGGDLDDRFGTASIIGGQALYKTRKNWVYGFNGGFIFGNKVNEEGLLDAISTSNGQVIGLDGLYADVRIFERGYMVGATFGKLFSFKRPNPNSGILVTAGTGFIQHKIRIETIGNTVPALRKEYLKGYDHLTNGWQLNEFVGYVYFSNKQLLNFFGGFEFVQGFTQNRRDFNFDNPDNDKGKRLDLMYGVKLGWILPLYKKKPAAFYLY
jgi:hypothetical protein